MDSGLESEIQRHLGIEPLHLSPLSGGCIGEVYRVELADLSQCVCKVGRDGETGLDIEGFMLRYLAERSELPVPKVLYSSSNLLVMEFIEGDSAFSSSAEHDAASLLARLHSISSEKFGLDRDTLIGGLHQPNTQSDSWISFFRDQRLIHFSQLAMTEGKMGLDTFRRLDKFASKLDQFISEPERPALLHGDVWTTNVLAGHDKITGFLDPAVHYGHPEIELAFITLFNTFGEAFFTRYDELNPIQAGFFEERKDIYNLYPLLVHVRLFGGGYLRSVENTLARFGF
jgi:fructosamine-3-kinase